MKKYYKHFMTEDEIQRSIEGKDYWMDSDELMERLEKRQALLEAEAPEEESDDVEEAVLKQLEGMFDIPEREFFEGWDAEKLISYICDEDFESKYPDIEEDNSSKIAEENVASDKSKSKVFSHIIIFDSGEVEVNHVDHQVSHFELEAHNLTMSHEDLEIVAEDLGIEFNSFIGTIELGSLIDEKVKQIVDELNKK